MNLSNLQETIAKSKIAKKTFAEFLAELLHDKLVEIYVGDAYETISTEQISETYAAVFCGKIIGAYAECLIINNVYIKNKKWETGHIMFINERAIRALSEINGNGTISDMFIKSLETASLHREV